nr:NADH dehydrogenase subunit 1 [Hesionides sp. PA-2020]
MITTLTSPLLTLIMALAAMAFFTLLERKVLGYIQLRKGPNKVGLAGIPQPLADALKLFLKEITKPTYANLFPYFMAPALGLCLALLLWLLMPHSFTSYHLPFSVLMFLAISSMNVYTTLVAGWASNSKYALLGALRGAAQTISYEVSMTLIMLSPILLLMSLNLPHMYKSMLPLIFTLPLIMYIWFTTTLAETNRTPFDFAEGESELVSGFNTEYSGGPFAALFMAEYMNILFMSLMTALLFFSSMISFYLPLIFTLITMGFAVLFLWVRGTAPRMRYDRLMGLTWKVFLPISIASLMIIISLTSLMM